MSVIVVPIARELEDLIGKIALADYVAPKLHLYSDDLSPTVDTVLGDLTECVFDGYASVTPVWGAPYVDQNKKAVVTGGELHFTQTGPTADIAHGCFLTNTASTELLFVARFDEPFNFAVAGDVLYLTFKMSLINGLVDVADVP